MDKVYPDIARLTVRPTVPNRKFLRLREGWRPDDVVWGRGFSDEKPEGDPYAGRIIGDAVLMQIPKGADPEEYRIIQFSGSQISGGLSGSPMINNRTRAVCGMVKRTRDAHEDRGGYAVRAAVIMSRLPHLQAYPDIAKSFFGTLQGIFGNRASSLIGTLVYAAIVFLLGLFGLLFSYYFVSSPAWEAEYGYALTKAGIEERLHVSQDHAFDSQDNYSNSILAFISYPPRRRIGARASA